MNTMRQYQTDYIISWDFSDTDSPCVTVAQFHQDEKEPHRIVSEHIGINFAKSGCISLRQVIEEHEENKRHEAKRAEELKANQEILLKFLENKKDEEAKR